MSELKKNNWLNGLWIALVVLVLAAVWLSEEVWVQDVLSGWGYAPAGKIAEIENDLELTNTGKRIFRATRPMAEKTEEFNEHCDSHDEGVMVLGCYTGENIYIYEVTLAQIESANQVTAAHELLHAVWGRMKDGEKEVVKVWLDEVYQANQEWFDEELETYRDEQRIEEIWTRAGTKLRDLPDGLEKEYAKYFQNREKIVKYYEAYQEPFEKLRKELEELDTKIDKVKAEIEQERTSYLQKVQDLDARIDRFNNCANTAGCFTSDVVFERQRNALTSEQAALEGARTKLNEKIAENNARIEDYRARRAELGELNDAMNSHITIEEKVE